MQHVVQLQYISRLILFPLIFYLFYSFTAIRYRILFMNRNIYYIQSNIQYHYRTLKKILSLDMNISLHIS